MVLWHRIVVVWILPNARALQTLHALKDRGMTISTVRLKSGAQCNVAFRSHQETKQ